MSHLDLHHFTPDQRDSHRQGRIPARDACHQGWLSQPFPFNASCHGLHPLAPPRVGAVAASAYHSLEKAA